MTPVIDKEFAALIPPLTTDEYSQLEKNLLAEGCRDRLVVWGDILIDGHNRLQICTKHKIPYDVVSQKFEDREAAMRYIILNQFGRRNLSLGDRSLLALKLEPLYKAKAKANQQQSPGRGKKGLQNSANLFPMDTRKSIAEIAGVSHDTIDKVRKIVEHGSPEQVERIKDGGKGNSVSAVYEEIRKATGPPPIAPTGNIGKDNPKAPEQAPAPPPIKTGAPGIGKPKDDLAQIRGYVADLKNPGLARSFTAEMFLAEYEAFTERFIRGIGAFAHAPYQDVYPLLSAAQRRKMQALGGEMAQAIANQNSMIRGNQP